MFAVICFPSRVRFIGDAAPSEKNTNLMVLTEIFQALSVTARQTDRRWPVRGAKSVIFQFGLYLSIRDDWATASWTMDRDMLNCAFRYFYFLCAFSSSDTGSQWQLNMGNISRGVYLNRKLVMRCREIWKTNLIIKSTRFFFHVVRLFFSSFLSSLVPLFSFLSFEWLFLMFPKMQKCTALLECHFALLH